MGFFKKVYSVAADELKKSIEEKKNEMHKSLEDMKRNAMAGFSSHTSSKKADDDDDDDENEPRIMIGKLENGILTVFEDISELDDESLEGYEHLKGIIFPSNLTSLESEVICEQEKLEIVDFSKVTLLKEIPDDFISGETRIKEFIIPQGVITVGDGFLGECGAGTKVFVPSSVTQLGYINGNANNDQIVYLFAPNLDISDVEEDIKTLYVLPKHYGVYARKLKECDSEARLREMPEDMMNIYASPSTTSSAQKLTGISRKGAAPSAKVEKPEPTPLDGLVQKIKDQLQSLGLSSFILYGSDYEGDKEYEEIEQLGDEGLLESSSEYRLYVYDEDDGNTSAYGKLRKISIVNDAVLFDVEEEYENINGDIEIRGKYDNQTIGMMLRNWDKDGVENGLTNVLDNYLTNKTLIELNGGSEAIVVKTERTPEPTPESKPKQPRDDDVYGYANKKRLQLMIVNREQHNSPEKEEEFRRLAIEYSVIKDAIKGGERSVEKIKEIVQQYFDKAAGKPNDSAPQSAVTKEANENGMFSARMETLISAALQDGVLTDQEKAVLKKRAEKDGEDWDEVEMIINSRLTEIQKANEISAPCEEQVSNKKAVELNDIERALVFLSFKSYEGADYAFLFLIDKNQLYATDENYNTPELPSCDFSEYFEALDDYSCWIENISGEYQSFKQLAKSLVDDFTEARLDEYEGDRSALAVDSKYTVTVFVGKEKVYEEAIERR